MENQPNDLPKRSFNPSWIYLPIIFILLAAVIYLYTSKNKTEDQNLDLTNQVTTVTNDKAVLETEYNAALARLDQMRSESERMDSLLNTKDDEISGMKKKIESLLKQKKLSSSQLAEANRLIAELNTKMSGYQQQIIALKQENVQLTEEKRTLTDEKEQLTQEKASLTEEKKGLERTVELGSVLHASGIRLEAIQNAKNLLGKEKEKETDKAKKADLIRISFDLDDNRISESGEKMLYICVYDPSGNVIPASGSGSRFRLADDREKNFTASKTVPYRQGEKVKGVSVDWRPLTNFNKGTYQVEIYHMGYKIGAERVTLR